MDVKEQGQMSLEVSGEGGGGAVLLFPGGMVLNVMMEHRQGRS